MDLAVLSSSLRRAREWLDCGLGLAFPWPEESAEAATPITPPFCDQCGYPYPALAGQEGSFVCSTCAERRWHFEWARSGYRTEGRVRDAIVGFKYEDQFFRRRQLIRWLVETFDTYAAGETWDALVPVPLYHRRRRERGFNQAQELAKGLSRARGIVLNECLYRYRETVSQTTLERNARWENMTGAFRLKAGFDVKGLHLLLIDDVFTTGATANACAQVLARAGAGRLAVLTVARS